MSDIGPGDRVECVNDGYCKGMPGGRLNLGNIYTVASVYVSWGHTFLSLRDGPNDGGWFIERFRPIRDNSTDIEQFRKLVRDVTEKVTV